MPTVVSCQCGQKFEAADWLSGKEVPCPACGTPLTVPADEEVVELNPAEPVARIPVVCQCGKRFQALPKLLGKMVPCPACGNSLLVKRAPAELAPLAPSPINDVFSDMGSPLGQSLPLDQYPAPYAQPYGGQYYNPVMYEAPSRSVLGSFELGPRAIMALISCGVAAIVLMLLAMFVPPLIRSMLSSSGTNVASASPAPAPSTAVPAPAANTPASAPSAKPSAPAASTEKPATSSGSSWNPFRRTPAVKNWTTYNSVAAPYAIDFPGIPVEGAKAKAAFGLGSGIESPAYLTLSDGSEFGAGSKRFDVEVKDINIRHSVLAEVLNNSKSDKTIRVLGSQEKWMGEHPGLEIQIEQTKWGTTYEGYMRVYVTTRYMYLTVAGGRKGRFSSADAYRFLDSLKMTVPSTAASTPAAPPAANPASPTNAPNVSPNPFQNAATANTWTTHRPPFGGYTIDFPGRPNTGGRARARFGIAANVQSPANLTTPDGMEYTAGSQTLQQSVPDANIRRAMIGAALEGMKQDRSVQTIGNRDIAVGEHPGVEIQITFDAQGRPFEGYLRFIISTNHIYVVTAVAPQGKMNTSDANRFMDSLAIMPRN